MYLELDECCYSYASVSRNETFCVPNGEQALLSCIIINPHDNFTNLTVTWFRSTTEDMSEFDEIPAPSEEYRFVSGSVDNSLSLINCSHELYRDALYVTILNFTQNKNGYYWCQLSINNTLVQPSYRVQFSADNCSIMNQPYYRLANLRFNENRCAKYVASESDTGFTTTHELSGTSFVASSTESSTRLPTVTQQEGESDQQITYAATESDAESSTRSFSVTRQEKESDRIITYIAGTFSALLLIALLGVLALALSFVSYVHHQRKKTSKLHGSSHIPNKLIYFNTEHQCGVTAE